MRLIEMISRGLIARFVTKIFTRNIEEGKNANIP